MKHVTSRHIGISFLLVMAIEVLLLPSTARSFDAYDIFEYDTSWVSTRLDGKFEGNRIRMKRILFVYPDSTWKMPNFDCGWKWRLKDVIDVDSGTWSVYADTIMLKSQVCYKRNDTCIYGSEKYSYDAGIVKGERVKKIEIDKDSISIKLMRKFIKKMNDE